MTTEAPAIDRVTMRDLTAGEFARLTGMGLRRAREVLASGAVKTAYQTPGGFWRVAEWAVLDWQITRGQR